MPPKRGQKRKIKEEKENEEKPQIKTEIFYDSDDELSQYERERLKNIADRQNKFEELKVYFM